MLLAIFLGGFLGYLMGGPAGLMIGALAGLALRGYIRQQLGGGMAAVQSRFMDSMFAVMGALSKADGVVSKDEIRAAENVFTQLRLSESQRESAIAAFRRGKEPGFDLDAELAEFRRLSGGHPALLRMFLQVQISAVAADGQVHPDEHRMLLRIARGLGLPESQVEQLEAMLRGGGAAGQQASSEEQLADAYRTLGLSPEASDREIKKAYHKLMNENHPDKLAGQGLPDSMREMAERKTSEIASAYDRIREARKKSA